MKTYDVTILTATSTASFFIKADLYRDETSSINFYIKGDNGPTLVGTVINQPGLFVREVQE